MISVEKILRLTVLLVISANFLIGCETIKGTCNGAYKGAQKDVDNVVSAAKGETQEPQGLGIVVDKVMKTDQWIKKNMW